jgi:hypothetical protein
MTDATKGEIAERITDWMEIDKELAQLQKRAKTLREKKKHHTDRLVEIMRTNDIDCFDVNETKIIYTKTKTQTTLGQKQLIAAVSEYFKDDSSVAVDDLTKFILDTRTTKETETIRMK